MLFAAQLAAEEGKYSKQYSTNLEAWVPTKAGEMLKAEMSLHAETNPPYQQLASIGEVSHSYRHADKYSLVH